MGNLDELIAEGSAMADETFAHLKDGSQPLRTHWQTLNDWHSAATAYVAAHSPQNLGRLVPLDARFSPSDVYRSLDGALILLKGLKARDHQLREQAAETASSRGAAEVVEAESKPIIPQETDSKFRRGARKVVALLRDPLWGGVSALLAIGAVVAGLKLAG